MIDVSNYFNAECAATAAEKAKEERADNTFYSNMEKYKDTYDEVMGQVQTAANNGLDGCAIFVMDEEDVMDEYVRKDKLVPHELEEFGLAHKTVFYLLQVLGYEVKRSKMPLYKDGDNPLDPLVHPVGFVGCASINWERKG